MAERAGERPADDEDSARTWTYTFVLLVETVVLLVLWAAGRYFGTP